MDETQSIRFFNRGPSPIVRLIVFAMLSLSLLFVDARYRNLEAIRGVLAVPVQALQHLTTSIYTLPGKWWDSLSVYIDSQGKLASDNQALHDQHSRDALKLQQYDILQAENSHLRKMLDIVQLSDFPMQMAEIIYVERDIFKRKVYVDKGSQHNIQAGQVVMDETGIVGQVTRVYPWLSEITLITDKDHAVPIQVLRTGLRAVVFGSGDINSLSLRYMPLSADVRVDDELVTSGIDGTYPPGLPVAKVVEIERDPAYPFAKISCVPLSGVDSQRQLMIISGLRKLPELPSAESKTPEKKTKKARKGPAQ